MAECGDSNALFRPGQPQHHPVLRAGGRAAAAGGQPPAGRPAERDDYVSGVLSFVFLHELGHALIHELALPITGREEDVADQLAVASLLGDAG